MWGRPEGARGGRLLPGCRASGFGRSPTPDHLSLRACGRGPLRTGCGCGGCGHGDPSPTPPRALLRAGFAPSAAARGRPGGAPLACVWGVRGRALSHPRPLVLWDVRPGPASHWLWVRGVRAWGPSCPWHLLPCRGSSCVVRASRVRDTRWPMWLGTCPHAVVVAGGVPLWRASWPRVGAPRLVRSGRSRCSGRLSRRRGAFPHPGGCRPQLYWVAARGTWRPAENRALCACRWPLPRQWGWARSALYPFGAPRWGCPWRGPPALVLGCLRCGGLACVDPVTDASGLPYRPSFDGGLGWCTGAVSCGRRHLPFRVGGRHARVPRVCVCVLLVAGSGGPASRAPSGAPHLFLWQSCPSSLFGHHRAGVARALGVFFCSFSVFFPLSSLPPLAPPLSLAFCASRPGCPGPWRSLFLLRSPPPAFFSGCVPPFHPPRGPLYCCFWCRGPWRFVVRPPPFSVPNFFFSFLLFFSCCVLPSLCLPCLGVSVPSGPGCPGPWRSVSRLSLLFLFVLVFFSVFPLLFCPPAFLGSGRSWCSWPLVRLAGFLFPSPCPAVPVVRALCAGAAVRVVPCWCCPVASFALAGAVCCCLWLRGGRCWVWFAVCCFPLACFGVGGPLWPRGSPPCCVLWVVVASCSPVLCPVFCGSVLPCGSVLWCPAVRFALFCGRCGAVLLLGAVCGALCLSFGGVLCPRCVPPAVLCWVWLPACRAVSFALAGAVCCCLWLPAVRCWVWLPAVVFLWCVLSRLLLRGRVACCPAGCCGSLWCRVPLRRFPCSVVLCCRAVLCCGALLSGFVCWWCWFVSFPGVCGAVLRCASCCSVLVWSALSSVPRAVVCRRVLWCLPWRSVLWWCSSGASWRLAVPCCVLWCCVALWCRAAGLCCAFCFAAGVRFSSKNHCAVFENKNKIN